MCACRDFSRNQDLRFSKTRWAPKLLYEDSRLLRSHTGIGGGIRYEGSGNGA
jgi:hypothetical protein